MKKGKMIVIEGADGTGKATQTDLTSKNLMKSGYLVETIDFPSKKSFFGKLIYEGLFGSYGDFKSLHPKLASTFWAADRYLAKNKMESWLREGKIVIADRYVSANQLHQGGKIKDEVERKEFMRWLDEMEHVQYGIPRPDIILYLDVPYEISSRLMKERKEKKKASGSVEQTDQHEEDIEHQIAARESAIKMLSDKSWIRIQCSTDGITLLSIEAINKKIMHHILKIL